MVEQRRGFRRVLGVIEAKVIGLFAMVAGDLPGAAFALVGGGGEVLGVLAGRERVIDGLYREIGMLAGREIVLRVPAAPDWRFLLPVVRLVPELGRSGDLVVQVAAGAGRVPGEGLSPGSRAIVGRMGEVAAVMWRRAADWWRHRDVPVAAALGGRHGRVSELHAALAGELACGACRGGACRVVHRPAGWCSPGVHAGLGGVSPALVTLPST